MWKHRTYTHQIGNGLSKANGVHGNSHCVGESKDETDRSAQLGTEATADQEVGPA